MPVSAPVRVPVELRALQARGSAAPAGPRVFRLARLVSVEGLGFGVPLPEHAGERVALVFSLPDGGHDPAPLALVGRVAVVEVDEGGERRPARLGVRFEDLDEASRLRIDRYVTERMAFE